MSYIQPRVRLRGGAEVVRREGGPHPPPLRRTQARHIGRDEGRRAGQPFDIMVLAPKMIGTGWSI